MRDHEMQLTRRQDPYPWTWEPFAAWAMGLLTVLTLAVQVGRGLATALAGHGFAWPPATAVISSLFGVLAGDGGAGLAQRDPAGFTNATLVHWSVAVTVLAGLVAYTSASVVGLRRWGPWRILGMASRQEAERLLGRTRLRAVAAQVRPDLFGGRQLRGPRGAGLGADTAADLASRVGEVGHGLSPRFLPVRERGAHLRRRESPLIPTRHDPEGGDRR